MPLKLTSDINASQEIAVLDRVAFLDNDGDKFYILNDSLKKAEIRVKYIPNFLSNRDPDRFECILFENAYLTAENDVFELFENTIEGRLGWIFPISSLDSNENDFAENNSFKHYRHIAYQKLLSWDYQVKFQDDKEFYRISEIFKGLCICILSKDELVKLEGFTIENYALSLMLYDYLIFQNTFKSKKAFNKNIDIGNLRDKKHQIRIKKSSFDVVANQYTKSLFLDHLYQTDNLLTKYILLYQILEQFMQEFADSVLEVIVQDYYEKRITKNTLKEEIIKFQGERALIKKPFEKSTIKKETKKLFVEKCTFLFNDVNLNLKQSFEDVIYDLRNLITHNYRLLTNKNDELNEIILLFETVILELLIGFNEKEKPDEEPESNQVEVVFQNNSVHSVPPPDTIVSHTLKQVLIQRWNNFIRRFIIIN